MPRSKSIESDSNSYITCSDSEDKVFFTSKTENLIQVLENFKTNMPPKQGPKVTNNDLLEAINENNETISTLNTRVGNIASKLEEALGKITNLEEENKSLKLEVEQNNKRIKKLEEKEKIVEKTITKIDKIEKTQETVERTNRQNKIILRGSAMNYKAENIQTECINKLAEKLRIPKEQLKKSKYELGLYGKKEEKSCILITVSDPNAKSALFEAVRTVKPANISINEYLTPEKAKLVYELRKMKYKTNKFISVFTLSGKVYVTYVANGPKVLLISLDDVQN